MSTLVIDGPCAGMDLASYRPLISRPDGVPVAMFGYSRVLLESDDGELHPYVRTPDGYRLEKPEENALTRV